MCCSKTSDRYHLKIMTKNNKNEKNNVFCYKKQAKNQFFLKKTTVVFLFTSLRITNNVIKQHPTLNYGQM